MRFHNVCTMVFKLGFDGKNALLLILAHRPRCHAMEQTEVILLFRLSVTPTLKGAERAMLIQDFTTRHFFSAKW